MLKPPKMKTHQPLSWPKRLTIKNQKVNPKFKSKRIPKTERTKRRKMTMMNKKSDRVVL